MAVGANMACALDDAGSLTCWGSGYYGQLDGPDDYCVDFVDLDGDGFSAACSGDCDDTSPAINPADYDSDGITTCQGDCNDFDASVGIDDSDGDGYSECYGLDCDGGNWRNHVNASELILMGKIKIVRGQMDLEWWRLVERKPVSCVMPAALRSWYAGATTVLVCLNHQKWISPLWQWKTQSPVDWMRKGPFTVGGRLQQYEL